MTNGDDDAIPLHQVGVHEFGHATHWSTSDLAAQGPYSLLVEVPDDRAVMVVAFLPVLQQSIPDLWWNSSLLHANVSVSSVHVAPPRWPKH